MKMGITKTLAFWLYASAGELADKIGQDTLEAQDIKLDEILEVDNVDREKVEKVLFEFSSKYFSDEELDKIIQSPFDPEYRSEVLSTTIKAKTWDKFLMVFKGMEKLAPLRDNLRNDSELMYNSAGPVDTELYPVADPQGVNQMRMAQQGVRECFKFKTGYKSVEAWESEKTCDEHIWPANTSASIVMDKIMSDDDYNIISFLIEYIKKFGKIFEVTSGQNDDLTKDGGQSLSDWNDYHGFHPLVAYAMIALRVFDENGNQAPFDEDEFLNALDCFKLADREDFKLYDGTVAIYKPSFRFELPEVYFEKDTKVANNIINFITAIEDNFEYDPYNKMAGMDIYEVYCEYLGDFAVNESLFYKMLNQYTGEGELLSVTSVQRVNQSDLEYAKTAYAGLRLKEDSKVDLEKDREVHFDYGTERTKYNKNLVSDRHAMNMVPKLKSYLDGLNQNFVSTQKIADDFGYTYPPDVGKLISEHRDSLGVEKHRNGRRGWKKVEESL